MLNRKFHVSAALLAAAFLTSCSDDPKTAAGGTEAESTIALQVQLADGTPAARSRVRVLPENFLSDGLSLAEWTETDENGYVEFPLDPGVYTVEARNVTDSVATGAVFVKELERSETLLSDTLSLGALSRIEGYVAAGQGPSVIRIAGLDRFIVPDSSGHFVIDSLPPGDFAVLIESRSNRGSMTLQASAGESIPEVSLGAPRGFAVEDFESFSGISATGKILGDGWWYTFDADGKNLMPLWDKSLTQTYAGHDGCASGGCARIYGSNSEKPTHLGFLLGGYKTNYELDDLTSLMFSARGSGKLHISLDANDSSSSSGVKSIEFDVELSKVWQGFSLPVKAEGKILVNRIDFSVAPGDSVYLDDVFLGGVSAESLNKVSDDVANEASVYSTDWKDHAALLKEIVGGAVGTRGGEGFIDSTAADTIQGEVCIVTTTEDYIIEEDTTSLDSNGNAATSAVVAPGSLRDCAYRDGATWILFKNSGTYNLSSPLRIKSNKTVDGRGRKVRITGMGILTNESSNIIFENLTFADPSIATSDTTSRRAISIHNFTHHVWIDHCTFESYPLVEVDVKRGSHHVTISWSRFQNADTGLLFGLAPDVIDESSQTLTVHHNYFNDLKWSGMFARRGTLHAYNNFFMSADHFGVECTDSARCYMEKNVFNTDKPIALYRLYLDNVPVDSTMGFAKMVDNWITVGEDQLGALPGDNSARGYKPDYQYTVDEADADLAWNLKQKAGPR